MQTYQDQGLQKASQSFYHPGLRVISATMAALPKARVLDLGAPSAASFKYFKRQNCHIRFENLNDFLATAIAEKLTLRSDALIDALDRYLLLLNSDNQFDVILAWDIFCYLDLAAIDYLSQRLSRHCTVGAKLHMVRYWGNVYPRIPCEYYMVDGCHAVNNFACCEKRHLQKLPPVKALQARMSGFTLSEFHISEAGMHSAMTDVVFESARAGAARQVSRAQSLRPMPNELKRPNATPWRSAGGERQQVLPAPKANAKVSQHVEKYYGQHKSPALEGLLSLRLHQNARVLDLGVANRINEQTYRRYAPHIHFADLPTLMANKARSQTENKVGHPLTPISQLADASHLAISQHWKFDVIMGWDILSRYSLEAISHIMALIKPHVHDNTYMHLLHYVGSDREHILEGCNLVAEDRIELFKGCDGALHHRHTLFELIAAMGYGSVEQSFAFAKGMHENYHEYVVALNAR
ncbi:MAG TPA: hypothetical protein VIC26_16090 [Marinagarivorans sp.]